MIKGEALLISWHIGNKEDVTPRALEALRRLRFIAAEDVDQLRRELTESFSIDCAAKRFFPLPEQPDAALLDRFDGILDGEDVGVAASGGAPCVLDPGSWLIAGLRKRGHRIRALPGPAIFSTAMSLSGLDFHRRSAMASFSFFSADPRFNEEFRRVAERSEPVFVFLAARDLGECFRRLGLWMPRRAASVFMDLTKVPASKFPYADELITAPCASWIEKVGTVDWERVSDVAVLLHPPETECAD